MRGTLFKLFEGVAAPSYFILLVTGFLFATAIGAIWARRIGQNPDVVVDLGLACLLAGVVGGRLMHVIADGHFMDYVNICIDPSKVDWQIDKALCGTDNYKGVWDAQKGVCHPTKSNCLLWAEFWAGGLTYYGGFIGASLGGWWLLRRDKFPFWKAADMAGFAIPLGLGFGRMGCLLAGCCFGLPTSSAVGLSFPGNSPASEAQFKAWQAHGGAVGPNELSSIRSWSHPVHPTQIYESAASFAIALFCLAYVHGRKKYDGQVFVAFLVLYAIARFLLEFLRADERGGFLGLSTSQLIGLPIVAVAAIIHRARTRTPRPVIAHAS